MVIVLCLERTSAITYLEPGIRQIKYISNVFEHLLDTGGLQLSCLFEEHALLKPAVSVYFNVLAVC